MKIPLVIIGVVILIVVGLVLISKPGQHQNMYPNSDTSSPAESDRAPNFHLQNYSGKTMSLADFAGKPLVINSWAAWCPFCREELPAFAAVQEEFGDRVVIIAVDRAEPLETAKRYSDELGVTGKLIFLLDPDDSFYRSIGGFSMPETILVDREGNIREHVRGPIDAAELKRRLLPLL